MQILHQRDNRNSRRGKRKTYPKSDASDVGNWDISPLSALGKTARDRSLTQRMLQRKLTRRMMMRIVP